MSQLFEENIFISIGQQDFQIPKDLFSSPGNTPNFFSLGFAVFFSTPTEVFPGLERGGLLRPPSIMPPSVPNRSAHTFQEILNLLRGYPLHIRNETHRTELLRDCRYYHLKGLEQKLIRHEISFNLARQRSEIAIRMEDIRPVGISLVPEPNSPSTPDALHTSWAAYARPFADDKPAELVLEIGDEATRLHLPSMRADFVGVAKAKIARLCDIMTAKANLVAGQQQQQQPQGLRASSSASLMGVSPGNGNGTPTPTPTPLGELGIQCVLGREASVMLDGKVWREGMGVESGEKAETWGLDGESEGLAPPSKKRKTNGGAADEEDWIVRTGQWRVRVRWASGRGAGAGGHVSGGAVECVLVAVKIDALSGEVARNERRGFLGG